MSKEPPAGEDRMPLPLIGPGQELRWRMTMLLYNGVHLLLPRVKHKPGKVELVLIMCLDTEDMQAWQKQLGFIQN